MMYVHMLICRFMHVYLPTYIHTYVHTYIYQACLPASIWMSVHKHIHTYMHIYTKNVYLHAHTYGNIIIIICILYIYMYIYQILLSLLHYKSFYCFNRTILVIIDKLSPCQFKQGFVRSYGKWYIYQKHLPKMTPKHMQRGETWY